MYRSRQDRAYRKTVSGYHTTKFKWKEFSKGKDGFSHLSEYYRKDAEVNHEKWWSTTGNVKKIFSRNRREGTDTYYRDSRLRWAKSKEPTLPYQGLESLVGNTFSPQEIYALLAPVDDFWERSDAEDEEYFYEDIHLNFEEWKIRGDKGVKTAVIDLKLLGEGYGN